MSIKLSKNNSKFSFRLIIVFSVLLGLFIGYLVFGFSTTQNVFVSNPSDFQALYKDITYNTSGQTVMYLPAVMRNDSGVSAHVIVRTNKGTGKITINLNNVLVADDTQQSIRMAAFVAAAHEDIELNTIDINYDIRADASTLEGPSAGAAFTIATIAALKNRGVRDDVMMTGTINHDGVIGPAGKILEKASAAKKAGSEFFLVSLGSSSDINYTQSEFCYTWGTFNYCQPEFVPKIINISETVGINVVEVNNVDEALEYFLE